MFLVFENEAAERAARVEGIFGDMRKKWTGTEEQFRGLRGTWLYYMGKIFIIEYDRELRKHDLEMREMYKEWIDELKKLEKKLVAIPWDSFVTRSVIAGLLRRRGIQINPGDLWGMQESDIKEVCAKCREC